LSLIEKVIVAGGACELIGAGVAIKGGCAGETANALLEIASGAGSEAGRIGGQKVLPCRAGGAISGVVAIIARSRACHTDIS
jgi:hypothetical protein